MKKVIFIAAIALVSLTIESASARNIWRECGIGAMLFKETGWAAITSNIIWDLGTTATSSNVSSEDMCEGKAAGDSSDAEAAAFLYQTFPVIEEQTANGSGKHLTTMLNTIGCDQSVHSAIISDVRGDLLNNMSDESYTTKTQLQKAQDYFSSLKRNVEAKHAKACHLS